MRLQAICRSPTGWEEVDDLDTILRLRRDPTRLVWAEADVTGATEGDVRSLASGFGLDELAVEDALEARQRPKLETYPGHLLVILYQLDEIADQLEPRQIAAFIGQGFVIVLHHGAGRLITEARSRLHDEEQEALTVDRLLHSLLDSTVDDYEAKAAELGEEIEELELQALEVARAGARDARDLPSQYRLYTVKQQLSMLRRFALPMTRSLERLANPDGSSGEAPDESELRFRDVLDHVLRLAGQMRSIDELATGVLDLTRSIQADTLNDVNKKLSGWAAIIAAPALIVGLYGTNYGLVPTKSWGNWGFVFVVVLMVASAAGLYAFFKRRRWI
jgi:magnesium transporter